jgi:hypothetical protein
MMAWVNFTVRNIHTESSNINISDYSVAPVPASTKQLDATFHDKLGFKCPLWAVSY